MQEKGFGHIFKVKNEQIEKKNRRFMVAVLLLGV
jgi:hypothetical protein